MLKWTDAEVTLGEYPGEISLCINISNCPCHCKGCHSSYLAEDIGEELNTEAIDNLIKDNKGCTLIGLQGGDSDPLEVNKIAKYIKDNYDIKVGWYSGRQELNPNINLENFDYIKLGPYVEELGGLDSKNTNQRYYHIIKENNKFIK